MNYRGGTCGEIDFEMNTRFRIEKYKIEIETYDQSTTRKNAQKTKWLKQFFFRQRIS